MKIVISFFPPTETELMAKVDEALTGILGADAIRTENSRMETPIRAVVFTTRMTADGIAAVKTLKQKLRGEK